MAAYHFTYHQWKWEGVGWRTYPKSYCFYINSRAEVPHSEVLVPLQNSMLLTHQISHTASQTIKITYLSKYITVYNIFPSLIYWVMLCIFNVALQQQKLIKIILHTHQQVLHAFLWTVLTQLIMEVIKLSFECFLDL